MKKLTLIILAVALAAALAATAANADDYYFCFTYDYPPESMFAKIPGPGTHDEFEIVHSIPIPTNSDALTYDGENWWIYNDDSNSMYCFDQNGDYVRDFPAPGTNGVSGLGWDGQYLWIKPVGDDVCQRDIYGNIGPYSPFSGVYEAITIVNNKIISGDERTGSLPSAHIWVHDFNGNFLFWGAETGGYSYGAWESLAYYDGVVWAMSVINDSDRAYYYNIQGFYYDDDGDWDGYAVILDEMAYDLSICDADFINIAEASLGQIKAYFADK